MRNQVCKVEGCGRVGTKAFGFCVPCYRKDRRARGVEKGYRGGLSAGFGLTERRALDKKRENLAISQGRCVRHGCKNLRMINVQTCQQHHDKIIARAVKRELRAEYETVASHVSAIRRGISTYGGMPVFDAWNPLRGGSYQAGAHWIANNIGRRPAKDSECHIIDRRIGFVPGNLVWVPRAEHRRQEMIYRLLLKVKTLEDLLATKA